MPQSELERVHLGKDRQLVHRRFSSKCVGGRSKCSIGPLPERRIAIDKSRLHLPGSVRRFDGRTARVVIGEVPSNEPAGVIHTSFDFDQSSWAKVCPSEFFFARPAQRDRSPCLFGQSCGLDRRFAGMFTAESTTRIGNDQIERNPEAGERRCKARHVLASGCCVPVQTVSLPSSHSATAARGSIGACCT